MQSDATQRQTQMILAGHPRGQSAEERLLADDAKGRAWILRQRAIFERMIVQELEPAPKRIRR